MDRNSERARNNGGNGESPRQQRENAALKNYSPVKPGFDGTMPKIVPQRLATELTTASMDELKQADANLQGEDVEALEVKADLNNNATIDDPALQDQAPIDAADVTETDQAPVDEIEEEDGNKVDPKALADMSIPQIEEQISSLNKRQLNSLEKAEAAGKQRSGVADLIERRRAELG